MESLEELAIKYNKLELADENSLLEKLYKLHKCNNILTLVKKLEATELIPVKTSSLIFNLQQIDHNRFSILAKAIGK